MYRFAVKFGSKAKPNIPLSLNVLTFELKSKKGVLTKLPFLKIRTIPFFCQINIRPSGAQSTPTGPNAGTVVTSSETKPVSENVWADAFTHQANASSQTRHHHHLRGPVPCGRVDTSDPTAAHKPIRGSEEWVLNGGSCLGVKNSGCLANRWIHSFEPNFSPIRIDTARTKQAALAVATLAKHIFQNNTRILHFLHLTRFFV